MFKEQEQVYTEANIQDFTNILPFELQLSINDFTHYILSNCPLPSDNPFNISNKQFWIKIYYDNIMLKVAQRKILNELKSNIDSLDEKNNNSESQFSFYTLIFGKEQ